MSLTNPELRNPDIEEQERWFHEGGLKEEIKHEEMNTLLKLARILQHITELSPLNTSVEEMVSPNVRTSTILVPAGNNDVELCKEMKNRHRLLVANVGANPGLISGFTIDRDNIISMTGGSGVCLVPAGLALPPMQHTHEMFCASNLGTSFLVIEELG